MSLPLYLLRRILYSLPILLGVTLLIFCLFNLSGVDPAVIMLGKYANPAQIAIIHHELGLDQPFYLQYLQVLKSAFMLDFGDSWISHESIGTMLWEGIFVTLTCTLPALLIAQAIAIAIALVATRYQGQWPDHLLVSSSIFMRSVSILSYILGLQWFFGTYLAWFPITCQEETFPAILSYVALPIFIWVLLIVGPDMRLYRSVLIAQYHQSYVRTARAKGLSEAAIIVRHVLPNAMVPILTNIMMSVPAMVTEAVVLETFFGLPGAGRIIINAINTSDFPVIKAMTLVAALLYIAVNIITDVLYTFVDPRIKLD